jgi:ElaB/YqjD/DUF883 family membrane-anchored ribosome-binding protein
MSGASPAQIEREIEQTREELGDTVEALAAKTDVKARASETVSRASARVRQRPVPVIAIGAVVTILLVRRLIRR